MGDPGPWIPMRRFTGGSTLRLKIARRKVASPKQFIIAEVHSHGGGGAQGGEKQVS